MNFDKKDVLDIATRLLGTCITETYPTEGAKGPSYAAITEAVTSAKRILAEVERRNWDPIDADFGVGQSGSSVRHHHSALCYSNNCPYMDGHVQTVGLAVQTMQDFRKG